MDVPDPTKASNNARGTFAIQSIIDTLPMSRQVREYLPTEISSAIFDTPATKRNRATKATKFQSPLKEDEEEAACINSLLNKRSEIYKDDLRDKVE